MNTAVNDAPAYRLAALDMDGTLLNSDHAISPVSREMLRALAERGVLIAIATGRALSEMRPLLGQMPFARYLMGEGGACLFDLAAQKCLFRRSFTAHEVETIIALSEGADALRHFFIDDQARVECARDAGVAHWHVGEFRSVFEEGSVFDPEAARYALRRDVRVDHINLHFACADEAARVGRALREAGFAPAPSVSVGWELAPPGVDKGSGLRRLAALTGIPPGQTLAVGDGGNDLPLLEAAGLSVAMANACDAVRARADVVFPFDNDHDGAAKAIAAYCFPNG